MNRENNALYGFGVFHLDLEEKQLWQGTKLVNLSPKEFDTLSVLIQNSGHLVSKADLMEAVWGDTIVEEGNLNLIISNLRKALNDNAAKPSYIETVRKRGYRFIGQVSILEKTPVDTLAKKTGGDPLEIAGLASSTITKDVKSGPEQENSNISDASAKPQKRVFKKSLVVIGAVLILVIAAVILLFLSYNKRNQSDKVEVHIPFEELEVKRVVKESQLYETLSIYTDPKSFDKNQLSQYWVPAELGGKEVKNVEASIDRLVKKGWRYEKGSKPELFEFRYVKIFAPGDYAEVGTIERWYIPTCTEVGIRVPDKNVYLGPQAIDYRLKKINGAWLIDETTVPRPQGH